MSLLPFLYIPEGILAPWVEEFFKFAANAFIVIFCGAILITIVALIIYGIIALIMWATNKESD